MAVQIKADEITEIIRSQIQGFDRKLDVAETGIILSVGDGIARIYGLEKVMAGELLEFPHGIFGMALNLEQDNVGAVLFGEDKLIKEGDIGQEDQPDLPGPRRRGAHRPGGQRPGTAHR